MQIKVNENAVKQRIEAFIRRKREEINQNNLLDFLEKSSEDSCARIASNVYRIKDSKGHLRIKRVQNETGPSDQSNFSNPYDGVKNFSSIDERLQNSEKFLKLESNSIPKDIYQRLKIIEDHISHLQSISPEYSRFLVCKDSAPKKKTVYSVNEIDEIIASIESKRS